MHKFSSELNIIETLDNLRKSDESTNIIVDSVRWGGTDVGADVQQKYAETDFFYKKCKDVILQIHRHLDLNSEEVDV